MTRAVLVLLLVECAACGPTTTTGLTGGSTVVTADAGPSAVDAGADAGVQPRDDAGVACRQVPRFEVSRQYAEVREDVDAGWRVTEGTGESGLLARKDLLVVSYSWRSGFMNVAPPLPLMVDENTQHVGAFFYEDCVSQACQRVYVATDGRMTLLAVPATADGGRFVASGGPVRFRLWDTALGAFSEGGLCVEVGAFELDAGS
jgi:hypothetical protein